MAVLELVKEALLTRVSDVNFSSGELILRFLIAILIVIIGIFAGKLIKFALRKFLEKIKIQRVIKASFIDLFLVVVKWSVVIIFINFALYQLGVPAFTGWLTTILGVIPSLTGSLIIISVGFAIANYLKKAITESRLEEWQTLSQIFFYFVLYIFIIFALKTSLLTLQDRLMSDVLVIAFTILGGIGILINYFRSK